MKSLMLILPVIFLFLSCSENSTGNIETGMVEGRLVLSQEYSEYGLQLARSHVYVMGTNGVAVTDENGTYSISGIPPGTYTLYAYLGDYSSLEGYVEGVNVKADKISKAPDIVLGYGNSISDDDCYLSSLYVEDSVGSAHSFGNNIWFAEHREVYVTGRFYCNYDTYKDTVISIKLNGKRYVTITQKQRFKFRLSLADGLNNIIVWLGDTDIPLDEPDTNRVYYTFSKRPLSIRLIWDSYDQEYVDAGDLDIHLINEKTGDSCWYKNENPDWGNPDLTLDDPYLYPDENFYGDYSGYERLEIEHADESEYTVKVHYFTNRTDSSIEITPEVQIRLNNQYMEFTSPGPMKVGDLWTVARITIPYQGIGSAANRINRLKIKHDKFFEYED